MLATGTRLVLEYDGCTTPVIISRASGGEFMGHSNRSATLHDVRLAESVELPACALQASAVETHDPSLFVQLLFLVLSRVAILVLPAGTSAHLIATSGTMHFVAGC